MHRIRWRLTLTTLAVTLVSTVALAICLILALERHYVDEHVLMLQAHAGMVQSALGDAAALNSSPENLACVSKRLAQCLRTRIVLANADGKPLVDTAARMASERSKACAPGRFGCHLCHSESAGPSKISISLPLAGTGPAREMTLSASDAALARMMRRMHVVTLAGLLVMLLLMGAISARLAASLTAPVVEMNRMARRMAEGDLEQQVKVTGRDEVGELAATFNEMARRVRSTVNALAQEKGKLETAVAQMADGFLITDTEGSIAVFNPTAERFFGVRAAAVAGHQADGTTFSPDLQGAIARALAGEAVAEELRIHHPEERVLGLHASPFHDAEGATQGAVVVLQDRTEMRRFADLQRDFIANASHELRTPAAALQAGIQTLQEGAVEDEATRRRFLGLLARDAERLSSLLGDLLDLSRLDARAGTPDWEDLLVADLARGALELVRPAREGRQVRVEVAVPEALSVCGDRARLRQVLTNLLDNAIKCTPDGGEVRLDAREANGRVLLTVSDTGIGIPRSEQERIFERFYRVDKARSRSLGGTGLGLAIAREAVEAHGGTITVESEPGRGSTFTVDLPGCSCPRRKPVV